MPRGRPSKYAKIMTPEMLVMVEKFCKLGATNDRIADLLEVSKRTIDEWLLCYEEFSRAIKKGRDFADANVAESLYKRATGYSYVERTFEPEEIVEYIDGKRVDRYFNHDNIVCTKAVHKEMPPDTAAAFIWLRNRQPKNWKQQPEVVNNNTIIKEVKVVPASDYKAQMEISKTAS